MGVTEPIEISPADDPGRYVATDDLVWAVGPSSRPLEDRLDGIPPEQRFAARRTDADPTAYDGIYGVRPMELSVPGPRLVPCAGLTWVGVHPDHRRRGVLTAMLRDHFERVHADPRVHVSALHASEPSIYGRHGYGCAAAAYDVTVSRGAALRATHLEEEAATIETHVLTAEGPRIAARLRAIDLAVATQEHGAVVPSEAFYRRISSPDPDERRREPWRVLIARQHGTDVGHARFQRTERWENRRAAGVVHVHRVIGSPAGRLALVRRLVDLDLTGSVEIGDVAEDDALLHWLGGVRRTAKALVHDNLWIRLVDVAEALAQRTYGGACDVVIELADDAAPWNAGRWRVRVAGGEAEVRRSDEAADIAMSVADLGAAYLGGGNPISLLLAGLITEHRAGAVEELWSAMRTPRPPAPSLMF